MDAGDLDLMRIGQIDIGERDRAACGIRRRRTMGAGAFRDGRGLRLAGDVGRVVAAGNGDGDRLGHHAAMPVIDGCGVGQRQDLAVGKEIERTVGCAVTPARRTVIGIAGRLHHRQRPIHRCYRRELLGREL